MPIQIGIRLSAPGQFMVHVVARGGAGTFVATRCYTVTDVNGCTHTDCMVVNVTDIRCGNNLDKITICHTPPGNGGNPQTLCIAVNAVGNHIPCHAGD